MARCAACGEEISPGAPFCGNCGAAVDETPIFRPQTQPSTPTVNLPTPEPEPIVPTVEVPRQTFPSPKRPQRLERERRPVNPLVWPVAFVLLAGIIGGTIYGVSQANKPQDKPISSIEATTTGTPPVTPVDIPKPTIDCHADNPTQSGGQWVSIVHWSIANADTARIKSDSFDEAISSLPDGTKDVTVGSVPTKLTITATNKGGTESSVLTCEAIPTASTNPTPPPDVASKPKIETFKVTSRQDTDYGTAARFVCQVSQVDGVQLHLIIGDSDQVITPSTSYDPYDIFLTKPTHFTLKLTSAQGDDEQEFDASPATTLDPEPTKYEIISGLAESVDLSTVASDQASDALASCVHRILENASSDDLGDFRNAISARHGRIFGKARYQILFRDRPWYHGDTTDSKVIEARFHGFEKKNVYWLLDQEAKVKALGR